MSKLCTSKASAVPRRQSMTDARYPSAHNRGSILLLVVISILLLSILGAAFLQVTRRDREAAALQNADNIDQVAASTISYIGEVLKNDLLNDAGTIMFDGTTDEPYDYPWTNPAANLDGDATPGFKVTDQNGADTTLAQAHGGILDDTWLASTEPTYPGAITTWPHITNLNGIYLRLPKDTSSILKPEEKAVVVTAGLPNWQTDSNIPMSGALNDTAYMDNGDQDTNYEDIGVDADGDGILDSKWTWAPIRQISGVSYVMAVRIIDNSAMINANVALGQASAADTFDTALGLDAPRWLFPSELDFANFCYLTPNSPTTSNLTDFFTYRFDGTSPGGTLIPWLGLSPTRYDFWRNAARSWDNYGTGYTPLTINDEMEMRYRNGLNNAKINTAMETNGLGNFLRQSNLTETRWDDWKASATIPNYFTDEPRHQITTRSGAAIYAMRLPDVTADVTFNSTISHPSTIYTPAEINDTAYLLKKNINTLSQEQLALEVFKVLARNDTSAFEGMTTAQVQTYTNQFVASFADHIDDDNWITTFNSQNGVEAWPAITEVYTQRPVQVTSYSTGSQSNFWNATGNPVGTTGYVIELINPHTKPIPITDLYIDVTYTDTSATPVTKTVEFKPDGGTTTNKLSEILDNVTTGYAIQHANHRDTWLYPGQKVLIYHDSTGGSTDSTTSDRLRDRDKVADFIFDYSYKAWSTTPPSPPYYEVGNLVYKTYGGTYAVYECIERHIPTTANQPDDTSYTYSDHHRYWRRKIIAVDGGPWPVPDSDFNTTVNPDVSINLYPCTQNSGELGTPTKTSFPYQTVSVRAWKDTDSVTETDVAYEGNSWVNGNTYNQYDEARSTTPGDMRMYRWKSVTSATSVADPSTDSANWELANDENMLYVQANSIGSVNGLEAFAIKDTDFVPNKSTSMNPVAPHSHFFAQIGKISKSVGPNAWVDNATYVKDVSTVLHGSKYYGCINTHTVPSGGSFATDVDKWVEISTVGPNSPVTGNGLRGSTDQLLMTDQRATHYYWEEGRYYSIGDVVRRQNDTRTYVCTKGHTAATTINTPVTGSNWGEYWAEHWRSATKGYPIANIMELTHVLIAGPNSGGSGKTLSDILGDPGLTNGVRDLMLPLDTTDVVGPDSMAVPHVLALMQRLTVHEPLDDGLDNDGDGVVNNAEEMLIPGSINLNTVPKHLLEKILPIPLNTLRANVADAIINYRDLPTSRSANWRTGPGFASTAELYRALQLGTNTRLDAAPYANDDDTINSTLIDFENPDPLTNDGISNDREEATRLAQMLMGVASTRSDIFTAYILIRGYPSNDFTKGPVETKQLIAVFDRSNIISGSSKPKVLGIYEYN